jgi:hypothetical protein
METVCFSETSVSTSESTRRRDLEEQHRHPHRRENIESHKCSCSVYVTLHPSESIVYTHIIICAVYLMQLINCH